MPSLLSFHDQQHITRMFVQEQRVNMIFNQFVSSIAPEMRKWKDAGNKNSVWVRNPGIEKAIDKYLVQLQSNLEKEIKSGQTKAWNEAVLKNDKMVESYIKGMSLSTIVKEGLFRRNLDALELLQNRTENGLNISQRVWNIADQTKGHVELFLEGGISTGRSADQISRDFRQLLQNPEKRFRRVRNKEGRSCDNDADSATQLHRAGVVFPEGSTTSDRPGSGEPQEGDGDRPSERHTVHDGAQPQQSGCMELHPVRHGQLHQQHEVELPLQCPRLALAQVLQGVRVAGDTASGVRRVDGQRG